LLGLIARRKGRFDFQPDCKKFLLNVGQPKTGDRYFDYEQIQLYSSFSKELLAYIQELDPNKNN